MSGTPNQTAGFDFQAWNTAAEAQLRAEFQAMAINAALDAETPSRRRGLHDTFHYVAGIPVSAVATTRPTPATPTPTPSVLGAGSCPASFINQHQLKTVLFVMASTAAYALPSVIDASPGDRLSKIVGMLKEVAASGVVAGLSVKAVAAIEQVLLSRCEDIAASCAAPILAKTMAQFVVANTSAIVVVPTVLAFNAVKSLWHCIVAKLAQLPETSEEEMKKAADCWTWDQLVGACAVGTATVVSLSIAGAIFSNPVAVCLLRTVLYIALSTLTTEILNAKNQYEGWGAWLRNFIVPDERPQVWHSPALNAIERHITRDLICPITWNLIVDPVVGGPKGHVYEREALYRWLKHNGRDPLTNVPASALSYKRSVVGARLAAEIAHQFDARLVRF